MAVRSQVFFLLPECPGGLELLMTVTSLFTEASVFTGSTSFLCQVGAAKRAASHTVPSAPGSVAPMVSFPR